MRCIVLCSRLDTAKAFCVLRRFYGPVQLIDVYVDNQAHLLLLLERMASLNPRPLSNITSHVL